jgi:primosomal protein N' (replication factor Y)
MEVLANINRFEDCNYAEVLLDAFTDLENQTFTYAVPEYMKKFISLGTPVIVPFGENQLGGYVVNLHRENTLDVDIKVKEIMSASSEQILDPEYIELVKWAAGYYHTTFLSVLKTAIPSGILTKSHKEVELTLPEDEFADYIEMQPRNDYQEFCRFILREKKVRVSYLKLTFGSKYSKMLRKLLDLDLVRFSFIFDTRWKYKKQLFVTYLGADGELSKREKEVLAIISRQNGFLTFQEAQKAALTTPVLLRKLAGKGFLDISEQVILRTPQNYPENMVKSNKLLLNTYQQKALDAFTELQQQEKRDKVMLLHGVTGSGKTEVYLQAIEYVLKEGKTSVVLVPEISLTPQTVSRFRSRFGECIAVLHSALSDGERFDEWSRIKSGLARIIIGARSAIFAPCHDIGLIIIDEEHESSYKQDKNPRYNAKTVALKRAELNNATIILGSATPCIESYYSACTDKNWQLLELPERVENKNLPPVVLVDMRQEFLQGNKGIFSRRLEAAIGDRLAKKEQSIIFINRRGYSTFVLCRDCGYTVKCDDCSVSMVYHTTQECLKCHYCGSSRALPTKCPKCRGFNIRHFGIGTQKIETITRKIFPAARIARLDRDTTTRKDSHQVILNGFSKGEYDILIGTQMVAKGLDFPNVTLVGVIAADTALNIPDFRAGERAFQLITQVAGRSGRGDIKGEVIAQAYSLDHISIQAAKLHNFQMFYDNEIKDREVLNYPPFSQLVNLIIANSNPHAAKETARALGSFLKENISENIIRVLGPVPAGIPKIKGFYRFQLLIKTKSLDEVRSLLQRSFRELRLNPDTRIGIDIEPLNML